MNRLTAPLGLAVLITTLLLGGCTTSDSGGGLGSDPSSTSSGRSDSDGSADSGGTDSDGTDSDGTGDSAQPTGPACTDVWKPGETLPADYSECAAGSAQGTQDVTECQDDTRLIVFDDSLWAVTGDTIVKPDAAPVQDTKEYGAAYSSCTGE